VIPPDVKTAVPAEQRRRGKRADFPYWLVAILGIGALLGWNMLRDPVYAGILATLVKGVGVTIFVTFAAFLIASALGLLLAVGVLSRRVVPRQIARFYVEVMRGVPMLVLLFYVAFVAAPALVAGWNWIAQQTGLPTLLTRDVSLMWRAILALALGYAAFIAEIFRAGIQSVELGQIEAAKALGLSGWHRFRFVIMPQAIRTILPPLGNDFIALIKDSALVSVLGVADITQLGKIYAASSFRYFETYNVVAFLYLVMTLGLSLALRGFERRMRERKRG
jgi:His/Glu/Gln/Arg/opine family amino acid ABC transporter permease subunit